MKTDVSYYQNKNEFRVFVTNTFSDLVQLKKEGKKDSFNKLVLKIIPSIRKYINGELNTAIKKGHFDKGKYKADDFIDQLFIEIYNNIEEVENDQSFYLWLFKKTNDLLEDAIDEEEFDDLFFKNIDDYTKPEWDEMEENYSVDAGGDFLMIEELDDMSYNHNDYVLNHVFIEDKEKPIITKIDKTLSKEAIKKHIEMVLDNLPSTMRNVFNLSTYQNLKLEEIAQIQKSTVTEIEQLLKGAKNALKISFFNRYNLE